MKARNIGKGWLVTEESFSNKSSRFLTILNPRLSSKNIAMCLVHLYTCKHASFEEKVALKKGLRLPAYEASIYGHVIVCGDEPQYRAHFCHSLMQCGDVLKYVFHPDSNNPSLESKCEISIA